MDKASRSLLSRYEKLGQEMTVYEFNKELNKIVEIKISDLSDDEIKKKIFFVKIKKVGILQHL